MAYRIIYSETSRDQIRSLHPQIKPIVKSHILKLKGNPYLGKERNISFVDALSHVLISGGLKNIPALSFDEGFKTLGLTTIS